MNAAASSSASTPAPVAASPAPAAAPSAPAPAPTLRELTAMLRNSAGIGHKRDIDAVMRTLGSAPLMTGDGAAVRVGDDCAAIPDGDGYLLFAIEGFLNEFVAREPWFAGYCGVMVNVSDIYAMGGRPTAVVDALWSRGGEAAQPLLDGLAAAAKAYNVPIVGGHSNRRSDREQLSVAIIGRAKRLLTSFDAQPGEHLVAAIDLRGAFHEPYSYWNASSGAPAQRLRDDLELLPSIAEDGLAAAGKDISMAGVVGTALMLLECSGLGASIDLAAIPLPPGVPLSRWLGAFPSYGFLLSVADAHLDAVLARFAARDIAAAAIGRTDGSGVVRLRNGSDGGDGADSPDGSDSGNAGDISGGGEILWDFGREPLIGCGPPGAGRKPAHADAPIRAAAA